MPDAHAQSRARPKLLRCVICARSIAAAAVVVGRASFGPKCAARAGLVKPKPRVAAVRESIAVNDKDPRQTDLLDVLEAATC